MKHLLSLLSVVISISVAVPAAADITLYTNGPINGNINSYEVSSVFVVSDAFTLSAQSDVKSMSFGVWVFLPRDLPATIDWGISAAPFGSDLGSGTGTLSNVFLFLNNLGADIYRSTFTFPSVDLGAGTYYITLSNGATNRGDPLLWDENDGPSLAFSNRFGQIGSESFTL